MIKPRLLCLAFTAALALAPASAPAATSIKMLPPIQSGTADDPCWEDDGTVFEKPEGNKLLSWDGKNTIQCNKNTTISSTGELGVGTSDPQAKLDVRGDALISGNTGIGIGIQTPDAKLEVGGSVKVGTVGDTCSAAKGGAMRYDSATKKMQYCNETAWVPVDRGVYNCTVERLLIAAPGQMGTLTCPNSKKVLYGACWGEDGGGTPYIGQLNGTLATTSLDSFTCRIEGNQGLQIYATCCDGISAP